MPIAIKKRREVSSSSSTVFLRTDSFGHKRVWHKFEKKAGNSHFPSKLS